MERTDAEIMDAAMSAEEAFQSTVRCFKVHKSIYDGVPVRVVEYPTPPDEPINFSKPIASDATLKCWDFGDDRMARDFIKLQGWKAAARKLLGEQAREEK